VRIAFVTETFLPKVDGVVTRLVRTLEALADLGHEALVLAPPRAPRTYAGHRVVAAAGVPFPWYPELTVALPRPGLGRILDAFAPDIVHVVNPVLFGGWGAFAARLGRYPLVASFHTDPKVVGDLGLGLLRRPLEIADRELHNLAHLTLCTSPQMVTLAGDLGIRRARLWATGVDGELFRPERRNSAMRERLSGGHPEAPLLLYVGRLSREKRLGLLEETMRALPQARLALVGAGPAEEELRRRFAGTGTVFTGYLAGEELAAAYASADIFAFPSDSETLGFVAMEAMASGLPVVGARAGGVPSIVRDGETGLLFAPRDGADLTAQLRRLVEDEGLRRRLATAAHASMATRGWLGATEALIDRYGAARRVWRRAGGGRR
jgi:glycosyltransferase involved in cell wall biosynthesis